MVANLCEEIENLESEIAWTAQHQHGRSSDEVQHEIQCLSRERRRLQDKQLEETEETDIFEDARWQAAYQNEVQCLFMNGGQPL